MKKNIVKNVKNHIKALVKGEAFIELFDVDNNSVIFYCNTKEEIAEGVEATPDGEYLFSDGMKVVVEKGVVTSVLKAEEVKPEETPEVVKPVNEAEETPDEVEVIKKENEELKSKLEEMTKLVEDLQGKLTSKEEEIKEAEEVLQEVQNFYSTVSNNKSRNTETQKGAFYIK